ncbi:MAG: hypothetical protein UV63_C0014G0006 [Microgenomates group bacterium GW2011_GWC1_43_11]|uniref:Uncharacterized protein n=1 Tax=Candidatus Gottesmanbacteria bacterium GW2011_GWA1_44_24b TaxID=1618437 RepID=A0A0G1IDS9_9BACT|nr:MAG: hypothetical protein UV63_C0014G0006 [Microgenomates group bacterium GW2011_GWC1_43_11]KKT57375.1 MAG: hypothetical protein UW52_C0068G0006 [Candidatus Gottesmanbacteria bacterium GW2011_GWA1_44_24b]
MRFAKKISDRYLLHSLHLIVYKGENQEKYGILGCMEF